jgi:adenosine deaminase
MCPISNWRTGVVASVKAHPIRQLFDEGLLVSVNTDDPKMFHSSLQAEYGALCSELGFTLEEIRKLAKNAVDSTWADADTRKRLHEELEASR